MDEQIVYSSEEAAFSAYLAEIERCEKAGDYKERNEFVLYAIIAAHSLDYPAGFRIDPAEPEWPVAFIELPTGQVSWHLQQHAHPWDGHTTEEKWARCHQYAEIHPATRSLLDSPSPTD